MVWQCTYFGYSRHLRVLGDQVAPKSGLLESRLPYLLNARQASHFHFPVVEILVAAGHTHSDVASRPQLIKRRNKTSVPGVLEVTMSSLRGIVVTDQKKATTAFRKIELIGISIFQFQSICKPVWRNIYCNTRSAVGHILSSQNSPFITLLYIMVAAHPNFKVTFSQDM